MDAYEFNPDEKEVMEIIAGKLEAFLPEGEWQKIIADESFEVLAKSRF